MATAKSTPEAKIIELCKEILEEHQEIIKLLSHQTVKGPEVAKKYLNIADLARRIKDHNISEELTNIQMEHRIDALIRKIGHVLNEDLET